MRATLGCTEVFYIKKKKKKSKKLNFCSGFNFIDWLINMIDKADPKVLARNTEVYEDRDIPVQDSITAAMNSIEKFNKSKNIEDHEH